MIKIFLNKKRIFSIVFTAVITFSVLFFHGNTTFAVVNNLPSEAPSGVSYMVYECDTKQTLMKQNIEMQADSSLLSRLMTCLLVLENPSISVTDYVSPSEDSTASSGRYTLSASNQYMVDHLIKAVVLCNADNAARVLADKLNPNREYFVSLMNQKAIELGMKNTYFTNVDGSIDELQRTTVQDMTLFWSYAMNNAQFRNIASNPAAHIWGGTAVLNECLMVSNNTFENASSTAGAAGVYTSESNLTTIMFYLISKQTDNTPAVKLTFIITGLTGDLANETGENYINNVFTNFKKTALITKLDLITSVEIGGNELLLTAGETRYCMMPTDVSDYIENISYNITDKNAVASVPGKAASLDDLEAPIEKGSIIGTANYLLKDGSIHTVNNIAGNSIHSDSRTINLFYKAIQENTDIFILISVLVIIEILLILGLIFSKLRKRF